MVLVDVRRSEKQLTRFIAHGTGWTDTEVRLALAFGTATVLVTTAIAATNGMLRLLDILNDA